MARKQNHKPEHATNGGKPMGTQQENSQRRSAEEAFNARQSTRTANARRAKEIVDTVEHMDNNPEWYKKNGTLINSVGNLPYGWRVGQTLDLRTKGSQTYTGISEKDTVNVPGIMTLNFVPVPGVSTSENSPINKAALANYRYIRFKKNGNTPYEVADLLMVYYAVDSLYCLWANAARAYRLTNLYTPMNDYMPKVLVQASGFDYDDIKGNMGDFLYEINMMAAMLQKIAVPKALSLYERHLWMLSNYFADSQSTKAQLYMYTLAGYYVFNNIATTGSQLDYTPFAAASNGSITPMKHSAYFLAFETAYNALVKDADFGTMMGDIENAYTDSGLMSAPMVNAGEVLLPVYSEEVLSQIENTIFVGSPISNIVMNITQDPNVNQGNILWQPTVHVGAIGIGQISSVSGIVTTLMNSHGEGLPSIDFNMVASRNHACLDWTTYRASTGQAMLLSCGTELFLNGCIWTDPNTNLTAWYLTTFFGIPAALDSVQATLITLAALSQFDWHPFMYIGSYVPAAGETAASGMFCGIVGDIDNYQIAEPSVMTQMHEVAIMSEFMA